MAAGRLAFDADKGANCASFLAKLDPASCWGPDASPYRPPEIDDCEQLFRPSVDHGGFCLGSEECKDGYCEQAEYGCEGVCRPLATAGQPCTYETCAAGLYCEWDTSICVPYVGLNDDCLDKYCADGLSCEYDFSQEKHRCVMGKAFGSVARGDSCDFTRQCQDGLFCKGVAFERTCEPKASPGEACTGVESCLGNQSCIGFEGGSEPREGRCGLPQPVGGACVPASGDSFSFDTGCARRLVCDPETKKCRTPPAVGERCIEDECADGWCNEGSCVARKPLGATCGSWEQCESWRCDDDTKKCVPDEPVCE